MGPIPRPPNVSTGSLAKNDPCSLAELLRLMTATARPPFSTELEMEYGDGCESEDGTVVAIDNEEENTDRAPL